MAARAIVRVLQPRSCGERARIADDGSEFDLCLGADDSDSGVAASGIWSHRGAQWVFPAPSQTLADLNLVSSFDTLARHRDDELRRQRRLHRRRGYLGRV